MESKTYVIAEIGCNHCGSLETAKLMVDKVALSGCDAAKFQVFHASALASKFADSAEYQKEAVGDESQLEMLEKLELADDDYRVLKQYCEEKGLDFFATPFDVSAVDFLESIGVDKYKIGSGDVADEPLIRAVAKTGKPIILSTGMSTEQEIAEAIGWIKSEGDSGITLMHCTSNYPTSYDDVNMRMMEGLADTFGLPVGYSDHTIGFEIPIMAVALGAVAIEKHVTLDHDMPGPDHKASLELDDLPTLVSMIRHVEAAFGEKRKCVIESERGVRDIARKSLVASRNLKAGDVATASDFAVKRPGTGIPPKNLSHYVGRVFARDILEDSVLTDEDFEQ